jgi:hypothetical protein
MTGMISQVDDAITVAAWHLGIDADTGYTDGYERELAAGVCGTIPRTSGPRSSRGWSGTPSAASRWVPSACWTSATTALTR